MGLRSTRVEMLAQMLAGMTWPGGSWKALSAGERTLALRTAERALLEMRGAEPTVERVSAESLF